ncbi:hypothetical protein QFZ80_006513 [Paenibacillus sp. V4I7]|nr:hypothetical protein [Paenibacillus sp. V4I7]MDQ0918803.1 hypothetical protein [Paenibacillus sp. V4I5]
MISLEFFARNRLHQYMWLVVGVVPEIYVFVRSHSTTPNSSRSPNRPSGVMRTARLSGSRSIQ